VVAVNTRAIDVVVDALRSNGSLVKELGGDRYQAQCPSHDDINPSLSITGIEGSVLICCHAGCDTDKVLAAAGLSARDLYDERNGATYRYDDGRVVHRSPTKKFRQSGNTKGSALFHAERIGAAEPVYVVEGEKDVLAVESAGGVAVCSAMGAGKAEKFDWSPLHGRDIRVVADKDQPGRKHAEDVRRLLSGKARSIHVVAAKVGKDAADHIAAGYQLHQLVPVGVEDGATLLDELRDTFTRYVVFPDDHTPAAVALWTVVTHALPAFECAPRLVVTSPEKRCAKSRLLDIIAGTCHYPLATVNATVAAVFRSLDAKHPPTLLIDEADAIFGNKKLSELNEDLRALLNAGHQRGRPALRCVGPNQTPTKFPTFAMAALAGIGAMPDTITDRAVNISMRRRAPGEAVSQYRSRRDGPKLQQLRERLAAWAVGQLDELTKAVPDMPVEDRAADTWEPLIAVADAAGDHWPKTARAACVTLVGDAESADEERSYGVRLLTDIRNIFAENCVSFLPSQQIVNALRAIDESPWNDFDLTRSKLSYRLREFDIRTKHNPAGTARGYRVEDFWDAFARYTRKEPSEASEPQLRHGFASDGFLRNPSEPSEPVRRSAPSTSASDGFTGSDGYSGGFTPPTGPGRCGECGFHTATQGHRDDCSKQQEGKR
jgi:Protein of unknown function (DUF3631)/Toprim domain